MQQYYQQAGQGTEKNSGYRYISPITAARPILVRNHPSFLAEIPRTAGAREQKLAQEILYGLHHEKIR